MIGKFYLNEDVVEVAKSLLGKYLFSYEENLLTGGIITETEAYSHINDKASHASNGRRTKRNEAMYMRGGVAYVYLCYGMHHLLNVVTNEENVPDAVLIRAIKPIKGLEIIKERINKPTVSGPALVAKALSVTLKHNGHPLFSSPLWIEEGISAKKIKATKRIGINYAGKDALLPWRFLLIDNI